MKVLKIKVWAVCFPPVRSVSSLSQSRKLNINYMFIKCKCYICLLDKLYFSEENTFFFCMIFAYLTSSG